MSESTWKTRSRHTRLGQLSQVGEKTEGSLEPGKLADLIVLSQDLFKIKPNEIAKTEVLLTMVGGKVVYQSQAGLSAEAK